MKKFCLFVCLFSCSCLVSADEVSSAGLATPLESDQAFDRYVDPELILKALKSDAPDLLTDVGLQLAVGESVLHRTHRSSEVSANAFLQRARKFAVSVGDSVTLARLGKAGASVDGGPESVSVLEGDSRTTDLPVAPVEVEVFATSDSTGPAAIETAEGSSAEFSSGLSPEEDTSSEYFGGLSAEEGDLLTGDSRQLGDFGEFIRDPIEGIENVIGSGNNILLGAGGEGDFDVSIKNSSSKTINVAALYRTKAQPGNSFSRSVWVKKGWWTLRPGQKSKIISTRNPHVYFFAEPADRRSSYSGSTFTDVPAGRFSLTARSRPNPSQGASRRLGFKHVDMGKRYVNFTYTFR